MDRRGFDVAGRINLRPDPGRRSRTGRATDRPDPGGRGAARAVSAGRGRDHKGAFPAPFHDRPGVEGLPGGSTSSPDYNNGLLGKIP
jgi:hypothetical protein